MPDATDLDATTPPRTVRNAGTVAPCTDYPLSDIIGLIDAELGAINADLLALLDELRRERAQEAKQAPQVDE